VPSSKVMSRRNRAECLRRELPEPDLIGQYHILPSPVALRSMYAHNHMIVIPCPITHSLEARRLTRAPGSDVMDDDALCMACSVMPPTGASTCVCGASASTAATVSAATASETACEKAASGVGGGTQSSTATSTAWT
jgi:hypothetical protein